MYVVVIAVANMITTIQKKRWNKYQPPVNDKQKQKQKTPHEYASNRKLKYLKCSYFKYHIHIHSYTYIHTYVCTYTHVETDMYVVELPFF